MEKRRSNWWKLGLGAAGLLLVIGGGVRADQTNAQLSLRLSLHAPIDGPEDYQSKRGFTVAFDGVPVEGIESVEGDLSETEVIEYKDGDDPITRKRAGKVKYKNIVLKREYTGRGDWYQWYKDVVDGKTERKSGSIIVLDREGSEVLRLQLDGCWPTKWQGPDLNARNSGHAVEKLEISWETMELKAAG